MSMVNLRVTVTVSKLASDKARTPAERSAKRHLARAASKRRTTAPVTALGLSDEGVVAHERLRLCGARAKRLAHVVNMECSQIAPQCQSSPLKVVP